MSSTPTSLGFSAKLLGEFGKLQTEMGQLICVAAVMDDVLSLCLLAEINALKGEDPTTWDLARPIAASLGSILIGGVLALVVFPCVLPPILRRLPNEGTARWCILIGMCIGSSTGLALASAAAGSSDLLGTFAGALPFSAVPGLAE
eukprot:gene6929-4859_t